MNFDSAFKFVVDIEAGYVNNPQDPGGETKFGISKRSYPAEDILNLTLDRAKFLYKSDYWTPISCDKLPEHIRLAVFDTAVNSGVGTAIILLQRTLKVPEDGHLGPVTIGAAFNADKEFFSRYMSLRSMYYSKLPGFKTFGEGWLKRLFLLTAYEMENRN